MARHLNPNRERPNPTLTVTRRSILDQFSKKGDGTYHHWDGWVGREIRVLEKLGLIEATDHHPACKCDHSNHWRCTAAGSAVVENMEKGDLRTEQLILDSNDF